MRKFLVVVLLVVLAISVTGCGCGGEGKDNGTNGGNVDYGGENPNAGKLISNTSTDPNALKPAKENDLIGEMKIPPHPLEIWTLFAFDKTEVAGERYKGWTEVPMTKEIYDTGIRKSFVYDNNKDVTFKISLKVDPAVTSSDPATIKTMVEDWLKSVNATQKETGEFKSTLSLVKGIWYTYEMADGKKGKVLAYALKGPRLSETEFGPGTLMMAVGEGPAAAFDEAMETGNLYYMYQGILVTQVSE